jgi:acyl carrier protein
MNLRQTIKDILVEKFDVDPDDIMDETNFDSLGIDSLEKIEFAMELEDKADVLLTDEQLEDINTITDLIKVIEE